LLLDAPTGIVAGQRMNSSLKMPLPPVLPPPVLLPPPGASIRMARTTTTPEPAPQMPERVGLPAKHPNDSRDETMIRALGLKVGRIVIDAGHGGHDAGSIGPGGMLEKDLVLDVGKRLGALVEQRLGCEIVYTRSDDTFIPLEQRTEIANDRHADLFLSIHANSSSLRTAAGVETYYLNFTTSKAALDVAARENATSQKTIFELQDLLQKIALKDKVDESREFAARIQSSLYSMSARSAAPTRDRGIRKAPFIVLIGASMPSVLAEIGFISNPRDEAMMKRAEYRQKIAEALYKGVAGYATTLSHFQVAQIK
jgi:N-acetylmuramoyl-L-alanine amidase